MGYCRAYQTRSLVHYVDRRLGDGRSFFSILFLALILILIEVILKTRLIIISMQICRFSYEKDAWKNGRSEFETNNKFFNVFAVVRFYILVL